MQMDADTPVGSLKGVGKKTEQLFARVGVYTVGDLLSYYPRSYDIYEDAVPICALEEGKTAAVTGFICSPVQISGNKKMQVTTLQIRDLTGVLRVAWFRMPFLKSTLSGAGRVTLRGMVVRRKSGLVMEQPEIFYPAEKYEEKRNTMQPVYPLTAGLSNHMIMKAARQALECAPLSEETIPDEIRVKYGLEKYDRAIRGIHFPEDREVFFRARERLVFEEFLRFIVSLRMLKEKNEKASNRFAMAVRPEIEKFIESLSYELTGAQKRVWKEIEEDMLSSCSMSRLIQGDVGSGKTIVAVLAMIMAGLNGYQSAMMAPTEVLAGQHFESITALFEKYRVPLKTELLTGSMTAKEKREVYGRIANGEAHVVIGTHALIQEKAVYQRLALVVTDEQHRFGVRQRESFAGKGETPHVLVMSATPIPRTLAIILYGDLSVSVIDELPSNRLPIKNCVVDTGYRETAYRFIRKQVEAGRQCYIICPMVEESEHLEAENVTDYTAMLKEEFGPSVTVEYLHGKMKPSEKDRIMERFAGGDIQVLVSTTVVEVGIDVPNATVMMVENAERFGLAQLHQLRGRVGRGSHQSYCIFMCGSQAKESKKRLEILNKTNDGFQIAGEDLKLRGPGDLFGIRQSGLMDFRIGDIFQDADVLKMANDAADALFRENSVWLQKFENDAGTSSVIL